MGLRRRAGTVWVKVVKNHEYYIVGETGSEDEGEVGHWIEKRKRRLTPLLK